MNYSYPQFVASDSEAPLNCQVPSNRVPVHEASIVPAEPLPGMHDSVRCTYCAVTVPPTCTIDGLPQLVETVPNMDGPDPDDALKA